MTKLHLTFGKVNVTNEDETHVTFTIIETGVEKRLLKEFCKLKDVDYVEVKEISLEETPSENLYSSTECQNFFEDQRAKMMKTYSRKFN